MNEFRLKYLSKKYIFSGLLLILILAGLVLAITLVQTRLELRSKANLGGIYEGASCVNENAGIETITGQYVCKGIYTDADNCLIERRSIDECDNLRAEADREWQRVYDDCVESEGGRVDAPVCKDMLTNKFALKWKKIATTPSLTPTKIPSPTIKPGVSDIIPTGGVLNPMPTSVTKTPIPSTGFSGGYTGTQDTGVCRSNPVAPPPRFRWEANCDLFCTHNDGCPKTDFGDDVVKREDTGWCYGFEGGKVSRCLKLEWVGPKGGTHSDGCSIITGWACDPDDYNRATEVRFYLGRDNVADGQPAAGGTKIGQTLANLQADPGVAGECGGNPNHGYRWTIPTSLRDGQPHDIYAYAYRQAGDEPKLWNFENTRTGEKDNNNPVKVQCTGSTCPVDPPTGLTPTGSACTDNNQRVVLSWNKVQGADFYDFRADGNNISLVGINNNCQAHAVCVNNLEANRICDSTTCRVTAQVGSGEEYHWWVNARGDGCLETEPTNARFTVSGVCGEITPVPQACLQTRGDLNGDGRVDDSDFNDWRTVFLGGSTKTICNGKTRTDLVDFNIWRYYN